MPFPIDKSCTSEDYWNLPEGERAELINGQLYAMAPPSRIHQKLITELTSEIRNYLKAHKGSCEVYPAPFAVDLESNERTWVEPDISVICDKNKLTDRGCKGAPDWIIEIVSPASQKTDYQIKLFKYRTAGVREYWIVNPMKKSVLIYDLEHEEHTAQYGFDDILQVNIYDDFIINIADLL